MKKLIILSAALLIACSAPGFAGKSKKSSLKNRSEYTTEQREKIYKEAVTTCRKRFGVTFVRAEIDYRYGRFVCWHH